MKEVGHDWQTVRQEVNDTIKELKKQGVDVNSHLTKDTVGLGDVVQSTLTKLGITEKRFKEWFGLKECKCQERQKWLNGLLSWKANKK
jgi:hypothetical protein